MEAAAVEERQKKGPVVQPRLLDFHQAGQYCNVSPWTIRAWVDNGALATVKLPAYGKDGRTLRRALVDVRELDRLIESSRETER